MHPVRTVRRIAWRGAPAVDGDRAVPEETAIAFTYNGSSHAVMMATPQDLEDFAVGFSLSEDRIRSAGEIESLEVVPLEEGIELRMWLVEERMSQLRERHRRMLGPTGCGLCGVESLAEALPRPRHVNGDSRFRPEHILAALGSLTEAQKLNGETRAVHAAALWKPDGGLIAVREDVGRHNALDKLIGALARGGQEAGGGVLVLSSRVSVEMVQKAAVLGVPLLAAMSAPTALAIRTAEQAGITLVAVARDDGFEVFAHSRRMVLPGATPL
ncbi:MAG: formate dehydrogenase accessory sulfurtransferase FdhD [Hyphomicrobiales bacterium]